ADFDLTEQQVTKLQGVQNVTFWAPSSIDIATFGGDVKAAGQYQTVAGFSDFCAQTLSTQVVPAADQDASEVIAYRDALVAFDATVKPTRAGLLGYIAADSFIASLRAISPAVTTEGLVDQIEKEASLDVGLGAPLAFSASD